MTYPQSTRAALEQVESTIRTTPSEAHGTVVSRATIIDGTRCEIREDTWTLHVDVPEIGGGTNTAPSPGVFGRAALGSCIAIGYMIWAARMGVPINNLHVDVEADYDLHGGLGMSDDVPPGYTEVRYTITIDSPAPEIKLRQLAETAERYSAYRDVFSRAQSLKGSLRIAPSEAAA